MQDNNQRQQFQEIIEQHKGIFFKVARTYCANESDRLDLIQEIMIQCWLSFHKYKADYKITTWLYRIALNVAISNFRKTKTRTSQNLPLIDNVAAAEADERAEKEQQLNLLETAVRSLKEIDRALIFLYLEERTYKEIAEILGISETNVATKISRIKVVLKDQLSK